MGLTYQEKEAVHREYRNTIQYFNTEECSEVAERYDVECLLDKIKADVNSIIQSLKDYDSYSAYHDLDVLAQKLY